MIADMLNHKRDNTVLPNKSVSECTKKWIIIIFVLLINSSVFAQPSDISVQEENSQRFADIPVIYDNESGKIKFEEDATIKSPSDISEFYNLLKKIEIHISDIESEIIDLKRIEKSKINNKPSHLNNGLVSQNIQSVKATSTEIKSGPSSFETHSEFPPSKTTVLDIENDYIFEYFSKLHGGISQNNNGDYLGNYNINITLNSEKIGLKIGTSLSVHLQNGHGMGITNSYVGDSQVLSNIDADNFTQVSEYILSQALAHNRLIMKIGKQDTNNDFNVVESAGDFINSSFGIMPNVQLPTFPDPGLGISAFMTLDRYTSISAGIFDGHSKGTKWGFDSSFNNNPVSSSVIELSLIRNIIPFTPRRGTLKLGIWRHGGDYYVHETQKLKSSNTGAYFILEQRILGDSVIHSTRVNMFIQYGYAMAEINEIPHYLGMGIRVDGFSSARPDDSVGISAACTFMNPTLNNIKNENVFECYYMVSLLNTLSIQPDFQYIANPGGVYDNAVVTGMRMNLTF